MQPTYVVQGQDALESKGSPSDQAVQRCRHDAARELVLQQRLRLRCVQRNEHAQELLALILRACARVRQLALRALENVVVGENWHNKSNTKYTEWLI